MPLLVLVLASLATGVIGGYVISRERFHVLATGGILDVRGVSGVIAGLTLSWAWCVEGLANA